ncbi:MAG: bifunctional [glutamine synthetase] adenylyltransferase/[glutamine synthetase]-adenylyl-L-tyrosine phosphorylase, partial [Nocardioidaceae bacterium]
MTPPTLSTQGRLAQLGFADSRRAEATWSSVGLPDDGLLRSLAAAADPDLALDCLARLLATQGEADAATLRSTLATNPLVGRRLSLVTGASAALGDHLVAHPADVQELAEDGLWQVRPTAANLVRRLGVARDGDELR